MRINKPSNIVTPENADPLSGRTPDIKERSPDLHSNVRPVKLTGITQHGPIECAAGELRNPSQGELKSGNISTRSASMRIAQAFKDLSSVSSFDQFIETRNHLVSKGLITLEGISDVMISKQSVARVLIRNIAEQEKAMFDKQSRLGCELGLPVSVFPMFQDYVLTVSTLPGAAEECTLTIVDNANQVSTAALDDFLIRCERAAWRHFQPTDIFDETTWVYDHKSDRIYLYKFGGELEASFEKKLERVHKTRSSLNMPESPVKFINIHSRNKTTELLSNFADTKFTIDGETFQNIESFVHYIKIDPNDVTSANYPLKHELQKASGPRAKALGDKINKFAENNNQQGANRRVYWQGNSYDYGSKEHHELLKRAITEKFEQNLEAKNQLLSFPDAEFVHCTDKPESATTSLPAKVFTQVLTDLRDRFLSRPT